MFRIHTNELKNDPKYMGSFFLFDKNMIPVDNVSKALLQHDQEFFTILSPDLDYPNVGDIKDLALGTLEATHVLQDVPIVQVEDDEYVSLDNYQALLFATRKLSTKVLKNVCGKPGMYWVAQTVYPTMISALYNKKFESMQEYMQFISTM